MTTKINIALIPADDRPVSYQLPLMTGKISRDLEIFIPPRQYLGNLTNTADTGKILEWLENVAAENKIDYIICALDTIAYGGLIPSRRCGDTLETIYARLDSLKKIIEKSNAKLLAFSSIMRISNNNINEEEKEYWDKYGKLIFEYSYKLHKGDDCTAEESKIPPEILCDYLGTRERNFSVNKSYTGWKESGFLLFTKDDTAPYGLNIREAEYLSLKARIHTGYDEVISVLLARAAAGNQPEKLKIYPLYSTPNGKNIIPRYEDIPLHKNIENHINLCNARLTDSQENADIVLLVHTPEKAQNDLAMREFVEPENKESVDFCVNYIENSAKPVILADVKNANGADDLLVKTLLNADFDLYGYAGWNTASNTLGTALSMGIMRYVAERNGCFSEKDFKKLLFVRFADDWAYQAVARQSKDREKIFLSEAIKMAQKFSVNSSQISLTFPWNRNFEIEIFC